MAPNTCFDSISLLGQSDILAEQLKSQSIFKPLTEQYQDDAQSADWTYWDWEESASCGRTIGKQHEITRKRKEVQKTIEEISKRLAEEHEMNKPFSAENVECQLMEDSQRRQEENLEAASADPNVAYWKTNSEDICEERICFSEPSASLTVERALLNAALNFPKSRPVVSQQQSENSNSYWDWDADTESGMTVASQALINSQRKEAIKRVQEKCRLVSELREANDIFSAKANEYDLPCVVDSERGYWDM
mmetsp:Transcript_53433/g.79410  ORF Transcript_53433/g.79410 Transcript_53433/m.79410 type:complete len:249 (+) Transcript_53433:107-853(+)|eukprot:CAMPEP_0195515266 /NCGR_PEP_ID=MMETSP0794_2-20130614/6392_1 /TAXON_ID=515487 /ORGANISM="Stephanopyxis turris, Strain CCMP 815" /LENGTH=248 /DNA_ID=CAMNT_0040643663 /DNA_START=113 /DNA_END=859 /DNA_ORIENTATION=+